MNDMTIGLRPAFASLAFGLLAGCFPTPSAMYTCSTDTDCTGGRTCSPNGFCVLPEDDDGGMDGSGSDTADPCMSFSARHFMACMIPKPTGPMNLATPGTYVVNTTNGSIIDPANVMTTPPGMMVDGNLVMSVESFTVGAGVILRVNGDYPLVIASWSTVDVSGTIDASSSDLLCGAGASLATTPSTFCSAHLATEGMQGGNGGGGGGGGAMNSNGGTGGVGGQGSSNDDGGTGGVGAATAPPKLAGGCSGQKGGNAGSTGGNGGLGGGAVQITAKTSISIAGSGRIHAGGAGGRQGNGGSGGGGGGGSGGMIGLEAPMLMVTQGAIIAANGGGGGEGGGDNGGTPGPGQNALLSATAATGGATGSGGNGGAGSTSATAGVTGMPDGAGGGGGGGGAGYVTVKATTRNDSAATYSPLPTTVQ